MQTTLTRRASNVQTAAFKKFGKKAAPAAKKAPAKRAPASGGDALWLPNTTRPDWLGE